MLAHVDGDAFFASVEQAVNPGLKGKPLVTGKERNIVAAASYEAKALGITRGVALWDAKKICKDLIILPTDYETVSLFSKRMYDIIRQFTPSVEEYSVDEAFADLSGMRRYHRASYQEIGRRIQKTIREELDITVTVGIAPTKTLCKLAAAKVKPAGFKMISNKTIDRELLHFDIEDIWNIGRATASLLRKYNITTALEFKQTPESRVRQLLTKPGIQTWQELNGINTIEFEEDKTSYQSIGKSKTFTPPSDNKEYVFAQLTKNLENACMKARRYHQGTRNITIYLRTKDFKSLGIEGKVERITAYPKELVPAIRKMFEKIWTPALYRATGVYLSNLEPLNPAQPTLFENPAKLINLTRLYEAIDSLRGQYGKHTVHLATALPAQKTGRLSARGDIPKRRRQLIKGESKRKRLPLPMLQVLLR